MFDSLSEKLTGILDRLTRRGALSAADVDAAAREVRRALLEGDVALEVVNAFIVKLKERAVGVEVIKSVTPGQMVVKIVHDELIETLGASAQPIDLNAPAPVVIMMVGLQGSGKTTTTAKLALRLSKQMKRKVLMASLDTRRPAAMEQLAVLGTQVEVQTLPVVAGQTPVQIAARAVTAGKLGGYDVVLLDTAGRITLDEEMMLEAAEVRRNANPHEVLLVADALTGQDAVNLARSFNERVGLSGIVLTRVDGDGRGGAALSMRAVTGKPIKLIGTGEKMDALEDFDPSRIAGRILAIRSFGKATFLVLSDGKSKLQIYLRQDALSEREFQVLKLLDFGDWVGVEGKLFRTKTDEFSVWASTLEFLAKGGRIKMTAGADSGEGLLPLPEKWHGLTDVETRYRQRYLDLIVSPESRRVFEVRSRVVSSIRDFLIARGYLEVETPMMQTIAGGALARPFVTHHNALDLRLYMRIAPELYLKRLTVGGIERVFEINRNFRNEGISTQHNPEFTMLEFYQAYADYQDLMTLTEAMLSEVARKAAGTDEVQFGGQTISLAAPFRRLSLREAARAAASRKLGEDVPQEALRSREAAAALAARLGVVVTAAMGAGKIAAEIFEALCEDDLVQPTFVYDFPTEVSPLSKQKPDDPDTVERFELYIGGFEVANAFSELNDPVEQRRRFEEQLASRAGGDEEAHAMDEDYIRALEFGMPPAAGEGIGIDRLVMVLTESPSIRDVILFPLMRPR